MFFTGFGGFWLPFHFFYNNNIQNKKRQKSMMMITVRSCAISHSKHEIWCKKSLSPPFWWEMEAKTKNQNKKIRWWIMRYTLKKGSTRTAAALRLNSIMTHFYDVCIVVVNCDYGENTWEIPSDRCSPQIKKCVLCVFVVTSYDQCLWLYTRSKKQEEYQSHRSPYYNLCPLWELK